MKKDYKKLCPFKGWVLENFPFIEADFDAITNYELLCKIVEYLNKTSSQFNDMIDNINYLNSWFENLDLQDEVDHKLDEMVEAGTLQEIIAEYLNSKALFGYDTVADMKSATNLINGSYAKTLGFYEKNDGGMATYKIRAITNDDTVDEMTIIEMADDNLVAELIVTEPVNILQLGAKGDNSTINDTVFATAIQKFKNIYIPDGTFIINTSVSLTDNYIIRCDGTIKMTLNLPAIIINGIKNKLDIKNIISSGIGIEILDTNKLSYGNELDIQSIQAVNIGIYLYSTTNGIQYNNFKGVECIGNADAIKLHTPSSGHHVNENRFYNYQVKSENGNGVHLLNERAENNTYVGGNRFHNIGFEGVYNAITLNKSWFNSFISCRSEESITNDHIIFINRCVNNYIQKDITPLNKINKSSIGSNSFNNVLVGRINNNNTNNEQIANEMYISDKGFMYESLFLKQINTFTISGTEFTLNDVLYNWILAKDNATITLGYSYCNQMRIGTSFTINTGNPCTIVDMNNKTIIGSDEASLQGYKNVKVTLENINPNNGECYWDKELL